jgi:ATP-dependent Lon protease
MQTFSCRPSFDAASIVGYAGDHVRSWLSRRKAQAPNGDHLTMRMYDVKLVRERERSLPGRTSEAGQTMTTFIAALLKTPAVRRLASPPLLRDVLRLKLRFPNFFEAVEVLARATALANLSPTTSPQFAPLLLVGAPGIGKTEFARTAARTFGVELHMLQFAHATASFSLGGLDLQYSNGGPGWLARTVGLSSSADPFVLLDEIEKASAGSYDPCGALFSLWDDSAAAFVDDGLRFPLDLSAIRWIATCNDTTGLHPALLSRCTVVEVPAPTPAQAAEIAKRIYSSLLADAPWGLHFEPDLRTDVIELLANKLPRDIKKRLTAALGHAALRGQRHLSATDVAGKTRGRRMGFLP